MASTAALQAHYDEVQANMPVLPLAAAPKSYANLDLPALDPSSHSKIDHALKQSAAGLKHCQICSRSSSADSLGYHISSQVDFPSRTVKAVAGQFACSLCRTVSSPSLLLEVSTPALGSDDHGRSEALHQLFLHFAAVNSAPATITGSPEALAVWVQELACRTYSMQVVASSLRGWKLLGPTGQLIKQGTPGAGWELLQQLLKAQSQEGPAPEVADGRSKTATARAKGLDTGKKGSSKHRQHPAASITAGQGHQHQQTGIAQPTAKRKAPHSEQQAAHKTNKKAKKHTATVTTATLRQQQQQQQLVALQQDTFAATKARKHKNGIAAPSKVTAAAGLSAAAAAVPPVVCKKQHTTAAFNIPQMPKTKKEGKAGKRGLSEPC